MKQTKKDMPQCYSDHWIAERHKIAKLCGLQNDPDLKILSSWLENSKWILELGHGDGRVVDYIISNDYKCNIVTIENNKALANHARQKYDMNRVHIMHGDIRDYNLCIPQKKFKLILMLWGLITVLAKSELEDIFSFYIGSLENDGFFVVDIPLDQNHFQEVCELIKSHNINDMLLNIYTISDIKNIAESCNLRTRYQILYTGRVLLFFSK